MARTTQNLTHTAQHLYLIYYTRAKKFAQNGKARYRVRKVQRLHLVCMNKEIVLSGKAIRTNTPNTIRFSWINSQPPNS